MRSGDGAGALATAREAVSAAANVESSRKGIEALNAAAAAQFLAGDKTGAQATGDRVIAMARAIREPDWQTVIGMRFLVGDASGAKAAADAITNPMERMMVNNLMVAAQVQMGDLTAARVLADEMTAEVRPGALSFIAEAQIKAGDRAGGMKTLEEAKAAAGGLSGFQREREDILKHVAVLQAANGAADEAKKIVAASARALDRPQWLSEIARAQAQSGDVAGAQTTVEEIGQGTSAQTSIPRFQALMAIAVAQAKAKEHGAARITASQIQELPLRESAYMSIVQAQADALDFGAAAATLAAITDTKTKNSAQTAIANARAKSGDVAGAKMFLGTIGTETERESELATLALLGARAGDIAGALTLAKELANPNQTSRAYDGIAQAQANAGDFAGALKSSASGAPASKNFLLAAVAAKQAESGDIAGAKATAAGISAPTNQAFPVGIIAFRAIALAQFKAHDLDGLTETLKPLSPEDALTVYLRVVEALVPKRPK